MTQYSKEQSARKSAGTEPVSTWKPKQRTCKGCKEKFKQSRSNQVVCSYVCGITYAKWLKDRKVKQDQLIDRKRRRAEKEKLKTLTNWKDDFQKVINSIVRVLDTGKPCLIRPNENVRSFDASHFYSRGSADHIRFSVKNIYLSGTKSNNELGGESLRMRLGLIDRHGVELVDELDLMFHHYSGIRLRIPDIKHHMKIARQILRELKTGKEMTRTEIDNRIGIYITHQKINAN